MNLFIYQNGNTLLHKVSVGYKLLSLLFFSSVLFIFPYFVILLPLIFLVIILYSIANIKLALVFTNIKPFLWFLLLIFIAQLITLNWIDALFICLRILVLMLFAMLITYTTRIIDLMDLIERILYPLERFGVSVAKVSLAIAITVRFIPLLLQTATQIKQAQQARGVNTNVILLVIPMTIKVLKMSENIANAVDARSFE